MLHAINQNKTKFYKRYLGHRDGENIRVQEEDEITSLIMSPLSLLHPKEIGIFWQRLVSFDSEYELPSDPAKNAEMIFWPRRCNIEPDMLVKLEWDSGEKWSLLVEFKWHAQLSGENQLQKQWEKFLSDNERLNAYHVFISPNLSCAINAKINNDVWEGRLLLRSWLHVLSILDHFDADPEAFGLLRWSKQVSSVLKRLQIAPFIGFDRILQEPNIPLNQDNWLFFNKFLGFTRFDPLNLHVIKHNFFKK